MEERISIAVNKTFTTFLACVPHLPDAKICWLGAIPSAGNICDQSFIKSWDNP